MPGGAEQGAVMAAAIKKRGENDAQRPVEPEPRPAARKPVKQRRRASEDAIAGLSVLPSP